MLTPNPDKDTKGKLQTNSSDGYGCKHPQQNISKGIQRPIKEVGLVHVIKVDSRYENQCNVFHC